jgi:membrane protease YdiL (CAAX protease family)
VIENDISKPKEVNTEERAANSNELRDVLEEQNPENENPKTLIDVRNQIDNALINPPWNIPMAISVWLISVFLMIFIPAFFIILYAYYRKIEVTGQQAFSEFLRKDQTALILNLVAVIPAHFLTLFFAWLVVTGFRQRPFLQTLGLRWKKTNLSQAFSVVLAFNVLAFALSALIPENKENEFQKLISSSRLALYLTALIAIVTAPLIEEIVYRGILYPAFERNLGMNKAIVLVSLFFGLVHIPQYYPSYVTIFLIFTLSVVLTVIRAYTGNLFLCVVIHTLHNFFQAGSLIAQSWFGKLPAT